MNPSDPAPKPKPCTFAMHSDPVENVCVGVWVCALPIRPSKPWPTSPSGTTNKDEPAWPCTTRRKTDKVPAGTHRNHQISTPCSTWPPPARASFHLVRNVNWQKRPLFLARWWKILLLGTTRPARRESRTQMGQTSLYSSTTCVSSPLRGRFHRRGLHRVHGIVHSNVFFFKFNLKLIFFLNFPRYFSTFLAVSEKF